MREWREVKEELLIKLLQRKELGGVKGRTPWRLSVRGKSNVPCHRKRHETFSWSHAARKACPVTQYNGLELQTNSFQRTVPVL